MSLPVEQSSKQPSLRQDAIVVLQRLRDAGHVTYFAGGCVRDLLLGIAPKDFDVATDATPERVRELFPRTQAVGAAFGVMLVRQGKSVIEVATFRSDGKYLDGRRPMTVRFTRAEEDAQRRDFTINGIFLDPLTDQVVDFVGGEADLKARKLRAIGDPRARFGEDHLRMLRAVRFAARLGFEIEPATAAALTAEAPQLKRITPERIAEELRLMFVPPTRIAAWALIWRHGLAPVLFRHLAGVTGSGASGGGDGGNRAGGGGSRGEMIPQERSIFLNLLPDQPSPFPLSLAAAAAAICYRRSTQPDEMLRFFAVDDVKQTVRLLRQAFRLSNLELDQISQLLGSLAPILSETPPTLAAMKRFLARETAGMSMELMRAMARAGVLTERIALLESRLHPLIGTQVAPEPLLGGDDLTALGYQPGPIFKRLLEAIYDAQLEGTIRTKDEATDLTRRLAAQT